MYDKRSERKDQAIVIGAGMGGLLAARALSDHFDQVLLIERDQLDSGPAPRKGVPQGRHVHALLARGVEELDRLFPGILNELVDHGARSSDGLEGVIWHQFGGYHTRATLGKRGVSCSRGFLESHIRVRVLSLGNLTLIDGASADELIWSTDTTRVVGVGIHDQAGIQHSLPADLIVDASGRGSRLPAWLAAAGYERPDETSVPVEVRYATRLFDRTPSGANDPVVLGAIPDQVNPRGGLAFAVESDCWMVTLTGRLGEQPPLDLDSFRAYARSLGVEAIAEIASTATPLDDGTAYSFRQSWYRRYDLLDRLPKGIVPFSDSICSFNPIYGQGMTVAAIEANALGASLDAGRDDLARRFLASITPSVASAWKLATGNDIRFLPQSSPFPRQVRFLHWYLDRLHVAARTDTQVARAFGNVLHMLKPPESLMRPAITARVLLHGRNRPGTEPTTTIPARATTSQVTSEVVAG